MNKWARFLGIAAAVFLLDQVSKQWVLDTFALGESVPLLPPFLRLTYSTNTGAAFGIFPEGSAFFTVLAALISLAIVVYAARTPANAWLLHVGLGLVAGGALGNIIDRLQHGHVIDFVHIVLPNVLSNVSNFADHAIVLGVGVLLLDSVLEGRKQKAQAAQDTAA